MGKGKEIKEYMEELQNSKNEVEISKESARDQLLDNVAIVDPQRLSRLYFAVADDRNLFVDVLKQRIEDRCNKDDKLFRKMYLYSELFSLDKSSSKEQKKLLKK